MQREEVFENQATWHRRATLQVELDSCGRTFAIVDGKKVDCGIQGLAILDVFSKPCTLAQALDKLVPASQDSNEYLNLLGTINRMSSLGILESSSNVGMLHASRTSGYADPYSHIQMLGDHARTSAFIEAVRATVRPGDVVIDIGTGVGILAVAAAQAGARKVYAIEATSIGELAKEVFAANGFADRIELVRGWSTAVDLPELADVLVSEMIGNEPLSERLIEITSNARRLLKTDARFVPRRLSFYATAVAMPKSIVHSWTFTPEITAAWQSRYGIDFSALVKVTPSTPLLGFINPYFSRRWRRLSPRVKLAEIELADLGDPTEVDIASRVSCTIERAGRLAGAIIDLEIDLAPMISLSTQASEVDRTNHWLSPVWLFQPTRSVSIGEQVEFNYTYTYGLANLTIKLL